MRCSGVRIDPCAADIHVLSRSRENRIIDPIPRPTKRRPAKAARDIGQKGLVADLGNERLVGAGVTESQLGNTIKFVTEFKTSSHR